MRALYQRRTGLFPEHGKPGLIRVQMVARATIPVVEALEAAGATVSPRPDGQHDIAFGRTMPAGLVAVRVPAPSGAGADQNALRLDIEPPYPIEYPDCWLQAAVTPCPKCGAPLVWYEAGYVPGYRVCARPPYHHVLMRR